MSSVLARGSGKERCFLRDQSIAVVLVTFFQPHQRKMTYLRAEEHRSLARTLMRLWWRSGNEAMVEVWE